MAKEKTYTEVLNLRIDDAMGREIKRIATQEGKAESETARMLLEWGIEAHRAREVAMLELPYDKSHATDEHGEPMMLKVRAVWTPFDPWELDAA
jgi:hypothetical protein